MGAQKQPLGHRVKHAIALLCLAALLTIIAGHQGVVADSLDQRGQSRKHDSGFVASQKYTGQSKGGDANEVWSKYVPDTSRTLAEELRAARESERRRAEREARRSSSSDVKSGIADSMMDSAKTVADASGITTGVKAVRKTKRKVEKMIEHVRSDADDEDDEENEETAVAGRTSRRRRSLKKVTSTTTSAWSFAISAVRHGFWIGVAVSRYLYNNCVWTPMTYAAVALRWSANASWQTTQWTSERALFGPARTATAPLVYLVEGLLFIFVMVPARFIRAVVRELYPVYVFLGAALAVGTAMGIAAAAALFIGSYVLGDRSDFETSLQERGEQLPNDIQNHLRQQYVEPYLDGKTKKVSSALAPDASWSSAAVRSGEGIIQKAIRESLLREERKNAQQQHLRMEESRDETGDHFEQAWQEGNSFQRSGTAPDSDEEDDYFGISNSIPPSAKGKSTASQSSRRSRPQPTVVTSQASTAYGRSLPVGATSQGGWSSRSESANSSPAASPMFARPSMSASPYAMAASSSSARSPLISPTTVTHTPTGPDAIRNHHVRQRRGVPPITPVK